MFKNMCHSSILFYSTGQHTWHNLGLSCAICCHFNFVCLAELLYFTVLYWILPLMFPLNHRVRLKLKRPTQINKMYSTVGYLGFTNWDGWASVWAGWDTSTGWFGLPKTINQNSSRGLDSGGVMIQAACGRPFLCRKVLRVCTLCQTVAVCYSSLLAWWLGDCECISWTLCKDNVRFKQPMGGITEKERSSWLFLA